ncbi:hypothetical protein F5B22DRAFT_316256 [Xylaria bambusicola]|uniref:uncharacterized protein n=1 Tax=Xylaria bambusicola TaxID=326684 RepID=UPI0020088FF3|nr:uncharacterized protein F5B22DRAFT_316256 [Xylaria bambusicola]KAI0509770.1 hypothetical protein F5B22DRAFT_316256 [Xylaria bambusicola]
MFRTTLLHRWHKMLGLPRQSPRSWHLDRYNEERIELEAARTRLEKLSEASDVFFAISRARYDGFPIADLPPVHGRHITIYGYMIAKYTSRWAFYRMLAFLCKAPSHSAVREVVNPSKDEKLAVVARRHDIDPAKFTSFGRQLRRAWPLLP